MSDDNNLHQTMKISLSELEQLQRQLDDDEGPEITIRVTPEILGRIDTLVDLMGGEGGETNFQSTLNQVFMAGLYALESEFK